MKTENQISETLNKAKEEGVEFVDYKFTDLPGMWHHFTVPASKLTEEVFEEGIGFDGSSLRGFKNIEESDMLLIPDASTAFVDPFSDNTLSLICDIKDPLSKEWYSRDPRQIAQKAEQYLKQSGIADICFMGPEAEFFVFDHVAFHQDARSASFEVDSIEGIWNSRNNGDPNAGHRPRHKEGYAPVPPHDSLQNIRNEMVKVMMGIDIDVECHHHEVATGGQCEIDMKFDQLAKIADHLQAYKYVVKNTAAKHGKTATFMPKPLFEDNGSGMHVHQSLWKDEENLFHDPEGYAGISELARHYIGGLLQHAPALCAFIAPTTNSYKRLVPGFEAPVNLVYSQRNRSAAIRIPRYSDSPTSKRVEFRTPDPSCNPYLAFSAMLMAGLDGIRNKTEPSDPLEKDIYELSPEETANIPAVPSTLEEALLALKADHQFLLEGDVFTKDIIDTWINYKMENEVTPLRSMPTPGEFHKYHDV